MALSEQEQKLLAQMEAALAAEDPKLVNTFRGTTVRRVHRRRATLAGFGFFVGLAGLIVGLAVQMPWISVVGFVVMVISAVTAIYAWQHVGAMPDAEAAETGGAAPKPAGSSSQTFMSRMEKRWQRRRDEDF